MDARVLLVCADQDSANLLTLILPEMAMVAEHTSSLSDAINQLNEKQFDAIILDYHADQASQEFLSRWRQSAKNRNSMLIAIVDGAFQARPAFGLGAHFVLYRPLSTERTRISLRAARGLIRRERRRTPRIPLNSAAHVAFPPAGEFTATLSDLSDGGTGLLTPDRIPQATKVYFEFVLPGQERVVRLSGEVAWQDASGRTGIRFLDVPQASRRLLQSWLQQQRSLAKASEAPPSVPETMERKSAAEEKDSSSLSRGGNRRGEHRFPCKLGAEVYRTGTTVPNRCTLSDISESGCYVEMPSPLPGQSGLEILVRTAEVKVKIRGQVLATHPGFGMGVRFNFGDSAEREEILRLLGTLAGGPSLDEVEL
jgi:CheY-like chemotaxis protein